MTRITDRRFFLAVLAALHFLAAPCVMAMTAVAAVGSCGHCAAGQDSEPCLSTTALPGNDSGGPAPLGSRLTEPPAAVLLPVPAAPTAAGLSCASPADRVGRATGRHTGDPPLNVLYGRFLN